MEDPTSVTQRKGILDPPEQHRKQPNSRTQTDTPTRSSRRRTSSCSTCLWMIRCAARIPTDGTTPG